MPTLDVNGQRCTYETEGDGFPLFLVSAPHDTVSHWRPIMPLLGELCKAITYEYASPVGSTQPLERLRSDRLAHDFVTLLDTFAVERAYLAATAPASAMVACLAQQAARRLEGLILIGRTEDEAKPPGPLWQTLAVPTLLVVGAQAPDHCQWAEQQVTRLPHGRHGVVPEAGRMPLSEQPQRLGHLMMQFLLYCERQRNLVRGASFLL